MEAEANEFNLKCHAVLCAIVVLCAWLNRMGIFTVEPHTMNVAVILAAVSFSLPIIVFIFHDWLISSDEESILFWGGFRFIILISAFIGIAATCIVLTFHAVLLMVLPGVYAAQYAYKGSLLGWDLLGTALLVLISVYGGYFLGLPDRNFFPDYMGAEPFTLAQRLAACPPERLLRLFEHYALPRFLAIFMINTVLSGIIRRNANIAANRVETAQKAAAAEKNGQHYSETDLRQAVLESMSISDDKDERSGHDGSRERDAVTGGMISADMVHDGSAVKGLGSMTRLLLPFAVAMWTGAMLMAVMSQDVAYRAFSIFTALASIGLIVTSRDTQGRYRGIGSAYLVGFGAWIVMEGCRIAALILSANGGTGAASILGTAAAFSSFLPECCFVAGLILLSKSEFNQLHFRRVMLHAFAISFMVFMIVQKIIMGKMYGGEAISLGRLAVTLYFFVLIFTIVMVITIMLQTGFRGHTHRTNCSAIILTVFSFIELSRVFFLVTGQTPLSLVTESIGVLGLVIYSWAESDPELCERKKGDASIRFGDHVQDKVIWTASVGTLLVSSVLYVTGFFDPRDIYMILLAVLAYIIICKSMQANVYSSELIEHQRMENQHLEQVVKEKTAALEMVNEHLKHISGTDELTGLYNRRFGRALLGELTKGTVPFAFLLIDLNYFKQVNDRHGHDVGDQVLKETGRRLSALGDGIIPVRIGGDEFLVVVQEQDEPIKDRARFIAERICSAMDQPIDTADGGLVVTVCIGIAVWPEDTFSQDELYRLADKAMYEIKHRYEGSAYRAIPGACG